MREISVCPNCTIAHVKSTGIPTPKQLIMGEMDDNGIIHTICEEGHLGQTIYDAPRYQILLNSAARAFLDGYTNECVSVISTALERCYEFFVRVVIGARGVSPDVFNKNWNLLAKQSERQIGAFSIAYLISQGEPAPLDSGLSSIRNEIVHRGAILREDKALAYCEKVFTRIRHLEEILESSYSEDAKKVAALQLEWQKSLVPPDMEPMVLKFDHVIYDKVGKMVKGPIQTFAQRVALVQRSRDFGWEQPLRSER